ncbi:MAG TPA: peptidylprolyl isomerase, partial [Alphaproteobacteria bacterium]|nr:peptidylprolyl isomerase [Alphaproteobacteria bacterium]
MAIALLAGVPHLPATAQDSMRIAAVVNDDIISELDIYMRLKMAMLSAHLEDTPETRDRLMPQVLRNLIDDRLKLQEAKREGIRVNPADIDKRINAIGERNKMSREELETFLRGNGILPEALADQMNAELSWSRLVQRKLRPRITITDQEINDEAKRIRATVGQTEYKLYQIFLAVDAPDQEASIRDSGERLIEQLNSGADFESLASEFSQDEGALKGGDWGWLRLDQMEPAVAQEIQTAPAGQVIGPVRGTGGYYIAFAKETRVSGAADTADGTVNVKQLLWPLTANAAENEVNRALSQAKTVAPQIEGCSQMSQVAADAAPAVYRELGNVLVSDLPKEARNMAINQPIDLPSDPIRTNQGIVVYVICDRQSGDDEALSRTAIADRLGQQRLETLARGYLS